MIVCELPEGTTLYRAHTPEWSSRPLSGAGAALRGGRFNREGVEALYLSMEEATALREYQQTSAFLPPCTLCSYSACLAGLVDLRQLHLGDPWDDLWQDWREDWRHARFELHIEPVTWVLGDLVLEQGFTGVIFPSLANEGGSNVMVFSSRLGGNNQIAVNDPENRLPANRSSWRGVARASEAPGSSDSEGGVDNG